MRKTIWSVLLVAFLSPTVRAQRSQSKVPTVYPATPGSTGKFVYIPGTGAVATEGEEPKFDRKTAESFKQHCGEVKVIARPEQADYTVVYSEWWKRDLTVVKSDGEVVWAGSSFWRKKDAIRKGCVAIIEDWKNHTAPDRKEDGRE